MLKNVSAACLGNPYYRNLPDYEELKAANPFRLAAKESGFKTRPVIDKFDGFYDVLMCWNKDNECGWRDEDGSIVFSDIGGQPTLDFDPEVGHGSIWRLHSDDTLEPIMTPSPNWQGCVLQPRLCPANYGTFGGQIFFVGQTYPGRRGAIRPHAVYRIPIDGGEPILHGIVPNAGSVGKGIPGALMPGTFGRPETPWDGQFLVQSFMNCTIYRVLPDGDISPIVTLDSPEGAILPQMVINAPDWWQEMEER